MTLDPPWLLLGVECFTGEIDAFSGGEATKVVVGDRDTDPPGFVVEKEGENFGLVGGEVGVSVALKGRHGELDVADVDRGFGRCDNRALIHAG